jgi:hypothetical protein
MPERIEFDSPQEKENTGRSQKNSFGNAAAVAPFENQDNRWLTTTMQRIHVDMQVCCEIEGDAQDTH